jgi:hypothetical protein
MKITLGGVAIVALVGAIVAAHAQAADDDLWNTELAFERAITAKQANATRPMFHADFVGVDADGATFTGGDYFVRRSAETQFFDVEDELQPGAGVIIGTVLVGGRVQRFSRIWLQTPQGWRLVASQASTIADRPTTASPAGTTPSRGDGTYEIQDATPPAAQAAIIEALRGVRRAEDARDASTWAASTDDHFWSISPYGSRDGKAARAGQISRRKVVSPLPIVHDVQVRIYGDVAVMHSIQEPPRPPATRSTRLWVKHGALWQQALNHQTFIKESGRR